MTNHNSHSYIKQFALLVLTCVLSSAVMASDLNAAQQPIQQTSERLFQILQTDRDALKSDRALVFKLVEEVVEPRVDFEKVSALVLGKYWRSADAAQRAAFQQEFKALLVNTYATAFTEFQDWSIHFVPMTLADGEERVIVRTQVIQPTVPPIAVDYRMSKNEAGEWLVYDVAIEGISMVTNYRTSFARQIKQAGGLESLITELQRKNALEVAVVVPN